MNEAPVVLWCHPRSVSTAFERAFLQRKDEFYCIHEPFGDAYYFGPQRQSPRYNNMNLPKDIKLTSVTFETVCDEILARRSGKRTFVKDMAYHVFPRLKNCDIPIDKMINTFLIRDPHRAVPSMYKCSIRASPGWGSFDPNEMGYLEQKDLFHYVANRYKQTPIVVNAQDLVKNPRGILQKYCELVNIEFKESMSNWEPQKIEQFDKWSGWHEKVEQSTGFTSDAQSLSKTIMDFPQIVRTTIEENVPIYDYLNKYSIKIYDKYVDVVERVQRKYTMMYFFKFNLQKPDYAYRLKHLKMLSLKKRRLINDEIILYKIMHRQMDTKLCESITYFNQSRATRRNLGSNRPLFYTKTYSSNIVQNEPLNRMQDHHDKYFSGCDIFSDSFGSFGIRS